MKNIFFGLTPLRLAGLLLLALNGLALAQRNTPPGPEPDESFSALWITHPFPPAQENTWTCFRKTIDLQQVPQQPLLARIAVDSKYWLWINDSLVVFEGALKRGPTPNDTYFDEVNIQPFLRKGRNVIAVLVWYWHRDGYCHKSSGQMGLLFEATGPGVQIRSDRSWQSGFHPAFGFTSDPIPNYRLPEYNIRFYGQRDVPWRDPDQYKQMGNAAEVGPAGAKPWGRLWKRPFPQWKNTGLVAYQNPVPLGAVADSVVMKLPRNLAVTPYLEIEAEQAGLVIDIRTDNYEGGSERNVRTEYVTRKGRQRFETFGYMNGHEVIYRIPKGVKVLNLKYRATSFPTEHIGTFRCSDPFLNTLWQKSLNTMDINMRDAIQDPDRERAQWWGDAVTILGQILYTCDTNGHHAIRKAMSNLVEWQKPDGVLYSPVPSGEFHDELPSQMLASVGKYGFWHYFRYTADTTMVRYVYPHVERYLSLWQIGPDSLVQHRDGGWNWFDWGSNIDEKVQENAWYYLALDGATQMARLLGKEDDAVRYQQRMGVIARHFNQQLWTGSQYRSPNYKGQIDDRGHGLAVVAGLAKSEQYEAISKVLMESEQAGPYIEKYIIEALFQMNRPEQALARIKKRYAQMVANPVSTLWEGWQVKSATYGGGSYNHGWSGGMLTLLYQYVAGISPESPGYGRFVVRPQLGGLESVSARVPTGYGFIRVNVDHQSGQTNMTVTVPAGTEAVVHVPRLGAADSGRLRINGKAYNAQKPVSLAGLRYVGRDAQYDIFRVNAGAWEWKRL